MPCRTLAAVTMGALLAACQGNLLYDTPPDALLDQGCRVVTRDPQGRSVTAYVTGETSMIGTDGEPLFARLEGETIVDQGPSGGPIGRLLPGDRVELEGALLVAFRARVREGRAAMRVGWAHFIVRSSGCDNLQVAVATVHLVTEIVRRLPHPQHTVAPF
jgi:hypothetical protein